MSVNSSMTLPVGLLGIYPYHTLAVLFFGCILFRQLRKAKTSNPKGLPLPPGPKGFPLIGNIFDMPVNKPWLVYEKWCKTYGELSNDLFVENSVLERDDLGDIVYFNVLGQHFLVLGSLRRTNDLFEKRSSNYSDRIRMPMMELYVLDSFLSQVNLPKILLIPDPE